MIEAFVLFVYNVSAIWTGNFRWDQVLLNSKGVFLHTIEAGESTGGGTPYNGLYLEAPPERGTFFRIQEYQRVGISQVYQYMKG